MTPIIRGAVPVDLARIKELAVVTGMFDSDDVGMFDEMFAGYSGGTLDEHHWLVVESDDAVDAAAIYAPEPFSDRMWNLYFIAVDPERQSSGVGGELLSYIEDQLRDRGDNVARVLIVETSSSDPYRRTRQFYERFGYHREATIRQFYGPDDDKVVYWKSLLAKQEAHQKGTSDG